MNTNSVGTGLEIELELSNIRRLTKEADSCIDAGIRVPYALALKLDRSVKNYRRLLWEEARELYGSHN